MIVNLDLQCMKIGFADPKGRGSANRNVVSVKQSISASYDFSQCSTGHDIAAMADKSSATEG